MSSTTNERIYENLNKLKLTRIGKILENYLERVEKDKLSTIEALDYLLEEEKIYKEEASLNIRTKVAGFPYKKTLEEFDYSFQPSIDMKTINDLKTGRFIDNKENVILLGPPGVGKTHLAIGLGMVGLRQKNSTYFVNSYEIIKQMNKFQNEKNLDIKLSTLTKYKVLIIDEVGYLPLDKQGSNLFFQMISRRYERSTTILTSNRGFNEWGEIFGDNVIAAAILDRLLHHCTIINIKGESYRLKERKRLFSKVGGE